MTIICNSVRIDFVPDREYDEFIADREQRWGITGWIRAESVMDPTRASTEKIGEFVRRRRMANRLTQRKLGELAGVGTRLVSELERGKATLRMDAVNKVLHVFGKILSYVEAAREGEVNEKP